MIGSRETAVSGWRADLAHERAFLAICSLLFVASAFGSISWCGSVCCGGIPMPGGWTLSTAWIKMPGQNWLDAAASFLGMWALMMVPMMLPALVPMLLRYRRFMLALGEFRLGRLTALVGAGYFFVWAIVGLGVYPLGVALAAAETRSPWMARSVPLASGLIVVFAGCLQFTGWKALMLACCRNALACGPPLSPDVSSAWRHGLHLGLRCGSCCWNLMLILLVIDVMDPATMAIMTVAITSERIAPKPSRAARITGIVILAAGVAMITRSLDFSWLGRV